MKIAKLTLVVSTVFSLALPVSALAAGSGSTEPAVSQAEKNCIKVGKVYNKKTKKCEEKKASLDHESIYTAGRELAYMGRYDEAIAMLSFAPNKNDNRVLNMLGYSHRKLGNVEKGMAFYKHSISVDPGYTLVREYYREALVKVGDLAGAHGQRPPS